MGVYVIVHYGDKLEVLGSQQVLKYLPVLAFISLLHRNNRMKTVGTGKNTDIHHVRKLFLYQFQPHLFITEEGPDATYPVLLGIAGHAGMEYGVVPVGYRGHLHVGDSLDHRARIIGKLHHGTFVYFVIGWWRR